MGLISASARESAIETLLHRDRVVVTAALVIVATLSWIYVLWLSGVMSAGSMEMASQDMPGMNMGAAMQPTFRAWSAMDFAFTFVMWAVMMVGMMTPSVAPMVLLYASVGRKARGDRAPFASTAWFFAGYLMVWVALSVAATAAQWLLASAALLSPAMATTSGTLGAAVLIAAGVYQFTPLKEVCLRQCQTPMAFLARTGGFQAAPGGALRGGAQHGVYCLGCCWALMTLLFVGGVMNVVWLAGISIFILVEKTVPTNQWVTRAAGILFVAAGTWLLFGTHGWVEG
ncbi:MAG: hypothetical protein JWR75_1034 [Devosia sp.]|nr:hypothetical protein [Devosia sp.]